MGGLAVNIYEYSGAVSYRRQDRVPAIQTDQMPQNDMMLPVGRKVACSV
jgi:hypothetical protein